MSVMVMGATLFTGCGDDDAKKQSSNGGGLLGQLATAPSVDMPDMDDDSDSNKTDKVEEEAKNIVNVIKNYKENRPKSKEVEGFNTDVDIESEIIHDENNITIAVLGITYDNYSCKVDFAIQNANDEEVTVDMGAISDRTAVNNYNADCGYIYEHIPPNSVIEDSMEYNYSVLKSYGITELAKFNFLLEYDVDGVYYEEYYELETDIADSYDFDKNIYMEAIKNGEFADYHNVDIKYINEEPIFDKDGIKINSVVYGIYNDDDDNDKNDKKYLYLEIENTTDEGITVECVDIYLNGVHVDDDLYFRLTMVPESKAVYRMSLENMLDCELWNVFTSEELHSIQFDLHVDDQDYNDVLYAEDIELVIKDEPVEVDLSAKELYNKDGVVIESKGIHFAEGLSGDYYYWLLIFKNNTQNPISIDHHAIDVVMNGKKVEESYCYEDINPGEYELHIVAIYTGRMEENGIMSLDDLETIQIVCDVKDENDEMMERVHIKESFK